MDGQIARSARQLGAALAERRRARTLSQTALGVKASLRQATISAIENGEPGTELRTLFNLLAALDLELVVRPRTISAASIESIF